MAIVLNGAFFRAPFMLKWQRYKAVVHFVVTILSFLEKRYFLMTPDWLKNDAFLVHSFQ